MSVARELDPDTKAMVEALDQALADSELTQAEFAHALGTSAPRMSTYRAGKTIPSATFYLRALRLAAALRSARAHGLMTPRLTSRVIREALDKGDETWAFKMAIQARDHLHQMLSANDDAADAWEARPGATGREHWDALLAALVEHEYVESGRRAPAWTARPAHLEAEWILANPFYDEDEIRDQTPEWLAGRRIFVASCDLSTA